MLISKQNNIITSLTAVTGVTEWKSIQFSSLPSDDPLGYIQLGKVNPDLATNESIWVCGIGLAASSLEELDSKALEIIDSLLSAYSRRTTCVGAGSMILEGSIDLSLPSSFPQDGVRSRNRAFKIDIGFSLSVIGV